MNFRNNTNKKSIFTNPWFLILALLTIILIVAISIYFWPIKVSKAYDFALNPAEKLDLNVGDDTAIETVFTPLSEQKARKAASNMKKLVIKWTSSNPEVASVDEEGNVTALKKGTTTITASFDDVSASVELTVYLPIQSLTFDEPEAECNVGESITLPYTITPEGASSKEQFEFTSSDEEIASVDENGKITALAPGKTVITLTCGKFTTECDLTVYAPLKGISFEKEELEIEGSDPFQLEILYNPEDTTDSKDAVWESSDEEIATVDEEGNVTPVNPGEVDITATVGDFDATCHVTITFPLTGIRMNYNALTIRYGDSVQLPLSYEPYNTSDDITTTWTSNNTAAVKVNDKGVITAVGPGTATITATCGKFTTSCQITAVVPVTGVSISHGAITIQKGASATISASVLPANTTEDRTISWSSDNIEVAKVSGGTITAVGAGTCHIYASHGDYNAVCTVTVTSPMTSIGFEQNSLNLINTFSAPLSLVYYPADTTDSKAASWSSSDSAIATVDGNGVVTAKGIGTCKITAKVGSHQATATVTVSPLVNVESITLNQTTIHFEKSGDTFKLIASVTPENASSKAVSWTSSDSSIATVSSDGTVKAVGSGTTQIIASAGGKTAACTVTVQAPNKIVVLDPGHGGAFHGATYYGVKEEVINLKVAQYCKAYLEANYSGVTVYLTRNSDVQLASTLKADLEARAQYAQNVGADILVSLHFNASVNHNASGTLAFVSNQSNVSAACNALGNQILSRIAAATGLRNRGCVATSSDTYFDEFGNPLDYYAINRHCANRGIPGIIVEHCFMDYDKDFCNNNAALQTFGVADAQGIAAYLGLAKK